MEWEDREESSNVEDRRSWGRTGIALGGGGGLILLLVSWLLGVNPSELPVPPQPSSHRAAVRPADPVEEKAAKFAKVIFHDTEVVWTEQFRSLGRNYELPTLVLYSGVSESGCGLAQSAVGPFYCRRDSSVFLDLSFFRDMERQLHAPGEFARAYVIAHEVGHHVQHLLGYTRQFEQGSRLADAVSRNHMSVRLELQADFFAGIWAHYGQKKYHFLEAGDLESALNAANQIGDDRLQVRSRGYVVPDSFTHGTSAQRMQAFTDGFRTGDVKRARLFFSRSAEDQVEWGR